jgi:hypothetical protein
VFLLLAVLIVWSIPERLCAASLQIHLREANGEAVPAARARVRTADGKDHLPTGAQNVRVSSDRWFVIVGRAEVDVPAGAVEIRVERGPEYRPVKTTVQVADGRPNSCELEISRWINMRQRGYLCGEDHLHVPLAELGPQLAAEGLDFGTSLQWWNGPHFEIPAGDPFIRNVEVGGLRIPTSIYDVELEHAWGAAYIIGLPEPLKATSEGGRPNLPTVRQAHEAGALVCYQGGWSREVLVDALLGCVDVVNVCNNNFGRHYFQPRSRYSNLLEVPGFPVYPDTAAGMMQMNTDTYYRLLNCGLRLAAGAGTATGAKPAPVGYNRAYVQVKDGDLPAFLKAWRAGRNFVTNGPMLFLTVNGQSEPGAIVDLPAGGGEIEFAVEAVSDQSLTPGDRGQRPGAIQPARTRRHHRPAHGQAEDS